MRRFHFRFRGDTVALRRKSAFNRRRCTGDFDKQFENSTARKLSFNNHSRHQRGDKVIADYEKSDSRDPKLQNPCGVGLGRRFFEGGNKVVCHGPTAPFGGRKYQFATVRLPKRWRK